VLIFDIGEETGLRRARSRNSEADADEGRFELEDLRFHRRVREGYLALAAAEPQRYAVIDAEGSPDEVYARMTDVLESRLR
jgi:dTMP kinase